MRQRSLTWVASLGLELACVEETIQESVCLRLWMLKGQNRTKDGNHVSSVHRSSGSQVYLPLLFFSITIYHFLKQF